MPNGVQPALHELATVLRAPAVMLSAADGQVRRCGVQGLYRHDRRLLSGLEVGVADAEIVANGSRVGSESARFHGVVRRRGDTRLDPRVRMVRGRELGDAGLAETVAVCNDSEEPIELAVTVAAAADFAGTDAVKAGREVEPVPPQGSPGGAVWDCAGVRVAVSVDVAADEVDAGHHGVAWTWRITVPASGAWAVELSVGDEATSAPGAFLPQAPDNASEVVRLDPHLATGDAERLLRRSESDLRGLLLADTDNPGAFFLAAGSPWFFTLFGRDSVWAARFLLPSGLDLAGGTLRALAARQGVREDPESEEQPGKIPHELRRDTLDTTGPAGDGQLCLPPLYYGTIDATPLWVCLLHEAWRAGLAEGQVADLLPALRAALDWMAGPGDADGDGFLEYSGSQDRGLANQGWKDSADGIRWDDGTIAQRPLALCEVQGYAHAAAVGGAELLDAFGGDGQPWRDWAGKLRERFRAAFWVCDRHGDYPAVALDGDKRAVTGPSSNMAHLLGTGLLEPHEATLVARQLAGSALDSGYGLRTLSSETGGFNPLSYHCGSVWPHDTAVAVLGLAAEGHHETARALGEGLLRAAPRFDYRMPELYGGSSHGAGDPVTAYPASCSPQAWAAAGTAAVVGYLENTRPAE